MKSTSPDHSDDLVSFRQGRGRPLCLWRQLSLPNLFFSKQWDALTHDWPNTHLYAFPPIALLPQVIRRIRETKCSLLIVTPLWRTQVWFPEMIQLLSTAPWSIPLRRDLLSKVQGKIWHPQLELLGLHVWPLNGTLVNSRRESLI